MYHHNKDVPAHKLNSKTPPEQVDDRLEWSREDAAAADYDADWEQLPEQDISRVYWEPVDEGVVRLVFFLRRRPPDAHMMRPV